VRVARSSAEIDGLRDAWRRLSFGHPDADPDVVLAVTESRPEVLRPHVIVDDDGEAMLVARLEESHMPARFGYATLYRPALRTLVVLSGGMAGSASAAPRLVAAALDALATREADALLLHRVEVASPLFEAAVQQAPIASRQRPLVIDRHWVVDVPDDYDAFLKSMPKKLRDDLKRYGRRLEREFPGRVEIRRFDRIDDLDSVLEQLEAIAATTYQRGLGAGFDADADAPLVEIGLRRRTFRAWVLSIDGVPRAFELGTAHGERFVVGAKGYDPDYGEHYVGKVVQLRMLDELCADPGIRTVDFGFGDADYKRRLATRGWDETDLLIYGRTRRALTANAGRSAIIGADRLARRFVGPERIAQVKRRWRAARTPAAA
jgi:CelD/BcsL family acetyltransferase involved in cellulose biosynthesis